MEDSNSQSLGKRSAHGILALASRSLLLNIISFAASLVIYSVLSQRDVGIYTSVIAIQRIISFFTDFGFGAALIQKKDELSSEDIRTTFTLQFIITFVIFLCVLLLRLPLMQFFRLSIDAYWLLVVLVFTIFLSSFKTIPSILLERKILFHKLVFPQIIESLAFNSILIVLVLSQFGLSSYSWAFAISALVSIPFYYMISPWNMRFGISRESLHHLKFGLQFQSKNVLATIKDDLIIALLPRFLSFTEIGYIGFAQRNAFFVYRYVVDSVTKVTFSSYARIQDDSIKLRKAIEKSLFFVSVCMFPVCFGLMIIFPYIIDYFPRWNNKWEPAITSLIFFLLNAVVSSISGILVNILDSSGRVKTTLKLMAIWTSLTWILVPLGIYLYGYNGVAIAQFLITLTIVYTVILVRKVVRFSLFGSIYKPMIATTVMVIVLLLINPLLVRDFFTLFISIGVGGLVYGSILYILAGKDLKDGLKMLR